MLTGYNVVMSGYNVAIMCGYNVVVMSGYNVAVMSGYNVAVMSEYNVAVISGYNVGIMTRIVSLMVIPKNVNSFATFFDCMAVGWAADSTMGSS